MGDRSAIEWTDATWNPIRGCSRVSQGCVHCYAETVAARFSKPGLAYEGLTDQNGRWNGKIMVVEKHMEDPLRWQSPRRIFVNSMSDLFHENITDDVLDRVFAVMALARRHTFQVLTKRPERMRDYRVTPDRWDAAREWLRSLLPKRSMGAWEYVGVIMANQEWPLPNVWLGVSTEDQATADERIPILLQTPAAVRWISAEPLLGPLDLRAYLGTLSAGWTPEVQGLDWVVAGGESGPGARPCNIEWIREIVAQCRAVGVPVFVKQLGSRPFLHRVQSHVASTAAGSRISVGSLEVETSIHLRDRKGGDHAEWPADLRIREYPQTTDEGD